MDEFNKKQITANLKKIKEYREKKISKENGQVLNVKYLGNIAKSKEDKEKILAIYLIIERYEKDGKNVEIEQYYSQDLKSQDLEFLGGNNKNDGIDKVYLGGKYLENDKLRQFLEEEINSISKDGELDLQVQEQLEKVAKELGIEVKDIKNMAKLEENQLLQTYTKKQGEHKLSSDQKKEDEKEKEVENQKSKEKEETELTKSQASKVTKSYGKQELNIDEKYDGIRSLRDDLGLDSEIESVIVVYSDKLSQIQGGDAKSISDSVALVGIKKDGSAKIIDSLELDSSEGARPSKEAIKINFDGTARQDNKSLARYKTPTGYLSIQRGQYGEMLVYHGQKTREENRAVEFQLATVNIKPTPNEIREMQRDGKGVNYIDNIENEFAYHVAHGEKELTNRADYDGDERTSSHTHEKEQQNNNNEEQYERN